MDKYFYAMLNADMPAITRNSKQTRSFWVATATLVGAIVGVGVFGVPYAFSRVGWVMALLYLVALGGIQILQHLFYAEAGISTTQELRFVGLAEKYLGPRARFPAAASLILGLWAGILAYVVVGGTFLHVLLSPALGGTVLAYQLAWGLLGALVIYFDPHIITKIDVAATVILVVSFLLLIARSTPHINPVEYVAFTGHDWLLPYGVVLFSLSGLPAVLELKRIVGNDHKLYRKTIITGTLVAIILTTLLGFVVWGVTGQGTTEAAIVGLGAKLGSGIAILGAVCGFFAIATSYFATAMNLKETFLLDYHHEHFTAWSLAVGVPFTAFLLGAENFVSIISFSGAIFGGISAVIVALMYKVVTQRRLVKDPLGVPVGWADLSIILLTAGALGEATSVLIKWLK